MFRKKDKPNVEQVTRLQTEIRKGREAFSRRLPGLSRNGSQAHTADSEPRTGRLDEVFTAYGAPIGRV